MVRVAKDRMLEGYVPSAGFSANMKMTMSPIPEEYQQGDRGLPSRSLILRLDDHAIGPGPTPIAVSETVVPPLATLAQHRQGPACEEFAMDADDEDEDANEDGEGTVYDQVWCDGYGKWHRYDEWDYYDDYDYDEC